MKLLSIVILNWNGKKHLEDFLPSVIEYSQVEGSEIVVADNASTDGSIEFLQTMHPTVRLIRLDQNYGFTGGYNRALKLLDSKYFLLLNSDIEVTPNWLDAMISHMDINERCAACTPKIKDFRKKTHFEYAGAAGGFIDRHGYPFCRGRIFDSLEEDNGQYDRPAEIFWGSGACLMVRAEQYFAAGGLDEQFFAHMEEIDLCWRLKKAGLSINYIPGSTVYHLGGGTLSYHNPRKTYYNFRNSLLFLYKNLPPGKREKVLFTRMLLDAISAFRFLLQGGFRDFHAILRAHRDYYGMKKTYRGTEKVNKLIDNHVIVDGIYPGNIVVDFFLKGRKEFKALKWDPEKPGQ